MRVDGQVERRTVLQATGLLAVGGLVAACGSGTAGASASSTPAASTPSTGSTAPPGSASGAAGVAAVSDVPVGGGIILSDEAIVLTQPTAGDIKAFSAICTHQGCQVSSVENNEIHCPCHGSIFSAKDGTVIQGPATQPLTAAGVAVDGGRVVLNG